MPFLTAGDFPSVRAALDTTLDAVQLPDSVIELDVFLGRAERWLVARVGGDPSTIPAGDDADRAKVAEVLYLAALLAPRLPAIKAERVADYDYQRERVDWNERAAQLLGEAEGEVALVPPLVPPVEDTTLPLIPATFRLAGPKRPPLTGPPYYTL